MGAQGVASQASQSAQQLTLSTLLAPLLPFPRKDCNYFCLRAYWAVRCWFFYLWLMATRSKGKLLFTSLTLLWIMSSFLPKNADVPDLFYDLFYVGQVYTLYASWARLYDFSFECSVWSCIRYGLFVLTFILPYATMASMVWLLDNQDMNQYYRFRMQFFCGILGASEILGCISIVVVLTLLLCGHVCRYLLSFCKV